MSDKRKKSDIKGALTVLLLVIAAPFTVIIGMLFLGDRKYYFISLLLIIYALLSFFLMFEQRKAQPRELVVIAVMCAVGVAGRMLFFWLPQFKPVAAIVILSGIAFGSRCGFLIGAVTCFVSNFYFGQGPWTPWQMLGFGFLGLLSGLVFKGDRLSHKRLPLALFGAVSTLLIYGGIVNLGSLLITTGTVTLPSLAATYLAGLPMDAVHAVSTFVFLLLISQPVLQILDRVCVKYGFFTNLNAV